MEWNRVSGRRYILCRTSFVIFDTLTDTLGVIAILHGRVIVANFTKPKPSRWLVVQRR